MEPKTEAAAEKGPTVFQSLEEAVAALFFLSLYGQNAGDFFALVEPEMHVQITVPTKEMIKGLGGEFPFKAIMIIDVADQSIWVPLASPIVSLGGIQAALSTYWRGVCPKGTPVQAVQKDWFSGACATFLESRLAPMRSAG